MAEEAVLSEPVSTVEFPSAGDNAQKAGGKRTSAQRSTPSHGWKHEVHPSSHHEEPAGTLYSKDGVLTRHAAAVPAYRVGNAHKLAR